MTEPVVVGQVAVEVVSSAKALAKSLKAEVEKAFKDLDFSKAIHDAIGNTKIKLPVEPDVDTKDIPAKVRGTRVPKVPVELDPVVAAFQQEVRRQTAALAKSVNVNVPVGADTSGLREQLGAQLAAVKRESKIQVPTEPGAKAEYEAKLKAQLAEVAARVKQTVKVDVDKRGSAALSAIGGLLKGVAKGLPNFGGIASSVSELGGALQKAAGSSVQLGGSLAGAFTTATGPIGLVIGLLVTAAAGMAALAAAAVFAVPAITAVAGAAAAIPAAIVGAGAAIGTLALGFKGIAAAFSPKAGGGGGGSSVANQARQIAAASRGVEAARRGIAGANRNLEAAERGLATAELNVTKAQERTRLATEALSKARKDAAENIDDLGRALRGAQLDEQDAALGVDEALRALNEAKLTGNLPDIKRAQLAYEQAQLTLENASDSAQDLGDEQAEAAAKGVEGSDAVQAALRDQADALDAVRDAQNGVLDAQNAVLSANDGLKSSYDSLASANDALAQAQQKTAASGAAAAAQVVKLAPAAQRFVDAIKALKPAFEDLRLDVQQRLFQGLDKTVTKLGEAWIPALRTTLGRYADTFNGFFKNLGSSLSQPKVIADIQAGAEGARAGLEKIGASITTSLVPAFGALSRAAGPFLDKLGEEIAGVVTQFSNWVLQGEKTGGLKSFFDKASAALHDIFTTGKLVGSIIGSVIRIITGQQSTGDASPLDKFNEGLQRIANYLKDPKNQKKIEDFLGKIKERLESFGRTVAKIDQWVTKIQTFYKSLFPPDEKGKAHTFGEDIGDALVRGIIAGIGATIRLNFETIAATARWIVDKFKELFGIASPSTVFAEIGGQLIEGLVQGVTDWLPNVGAAAQKIKDRVTTALSGAKNWLNTNGRDAVGGLMDGIGSRLGDLQVRASGLKTTVQNKLSDAGSWLRTHGQSAANSLGTGIQTRFSALRTTASGLKTQVTNALINAGSLLYNAGKNIVIGLGNGIIALGPWLGQKVREIINRYVPKKVQEILGIASPSKVMAALGKEIPAGLAVGITSNADAVRRAAEDMAAAAVPQIPDTAMSLTSDLAGVSASLNKSATLELAWAPGSTSDKVYRAIQDDIKLRWSGNVQAALGSS